MKPSIVIVEIDPDRRELCRNYLRDRFPDADIRAFSNNSQLIESITSGDRYDVVIFDWYANNRRSGYIWEVVGRNKDVDVSESSKNRQKADSSSIDPRYLVSKFSNIDKLGDTVRKILESK
jgi:CheY-like chemotaxis protein